MLRSREMAVPVATKSNAKRFSFAELKLNRIAVYVNYLLDTRLHLSIPSLDMHANVLIYLLTLPLTSAA